MLADELLAIRSATAFCQTTHVARARVAGEVAFETIDALVPRKLFIRDGQAFQTIMLTEDARVLADACVMRDDEEFVVLAEGLSGPQLAAHIRAHKRGTGTLEVTDLSESHEHFSLHGPFAWELLAELARGRPVGVPYMTFFRTDEFLCLRAGKTGEYGYDVLVETAAAPAFRARCIRAGAAFDVVEVGLEALDECALENCFFNIRREGQADATPIELQLQWCVSFKKDGYVGAAALHAHKQRGTARRLTHIVADGRFAPSDVVEHAGRPIGVVVNASTRPPAPSRPQAGLALIEIALAHPGIDAFSIVHEGSRVSLRTVCPPIVENHSLRVNPQRHSYANRNAPAKAR